METWLDYFTKLTSNKRKEAFTTIKEINNYQQTTEPMLFQILNTTISLSQKNTMLKTYTGLISTRMPEKKLKLW